MGHHSCTISQGRYPTCSCGSHTWPCRVEKKEKTRTAQKADDDRIARAVADEIERRRRRR